MCYNKKMDFKELDKKQLILLTLLITFVVSIATGIVTVSLMNQMPKSVPQTINNVIQRTIEKVTTVEVPVETNESTDSSDTSSKTDNSVSLLGDESALIPIYKEDAVINIKAENNITDNNVEEDNNGEDRNYDKPLGYGVIISDAGLILFDSNILINKEESYKVILNSIEFDAKVLKEFNNGFSILEIYSKTDNNGNNSTDNLATDKVTSAKTDIIKINF